MGCSLTGAWWPSIALLLTEQITHRFRVLSLLSGKRQIFSFSGKRQVSFCLSGKRQGLACSGKGQATDGQHVPLLPVPSCPVLTGLCASTAHHEEQDRDLMGWTGVILWEAASGTRQAQRGCWSYPRAAHAGRGISPLCLLLLPWLWKRGWFLLPLGGYCLSSCLMVPQLARWIKESKNVFHVCGGGGRPSERH